MITINMTKAREIVKARLRREREPLLAAQDVAMMKANEINGDTAAIKTEKQRLRDVTKLADTASTPEALRALSCADPVS